MRFPFLALVLVSAACVHRAGEATLTSAALTPSSRAAADAIADERCAASCDDSPSFPSRDACDRAASGRTAAELGLDRCGTIDAKNLRTCLAQVHDQPCASLGDLRGCRFSSLCADQPEEGLP
jgi:hypothetical protein